MIERSPQKIKPEKHQNSNLKCLNLAKDRGENLSYLENNLPIEYKSSFIRVSKFIKKEDAKHHNKDWPHYLFTIEDWQLYANISGWIDKDLEDFNKEIGGNYDLGFFEFYKNFNIWIINSNSTKIDKKSRTDYLKQVTQKIETNNKSKGITYLESTITTSEIPQARIKSPETLPASEDVINMSLDLLSRVRQSIPESERKQFDSRVSDIISEE